MSTLKGKERLMRGEEISSGDETERKKIGQQVKKLISKGVDPGDAFAAAIENARRGEGLDFS